MQHSEVTIMDAITAVMLLEMTSITYSDEGSFSMPRLIPDITCLLHTTFPDDPAAEYSLAAETILQGLKLSDLWEKEMKRMKNEG